MTTHALPHIGALVRWTRKMNTPDIGIVVSHMSYDNDTGRARFTSKDGIGYLAVIYSEDITCDILVVLVD